MPGNATVHALLMSMFIVRPAAAGLGSLVSPK
jgi:hypothetical protein